MLELTGVDGEPGLPIPMQIADIAGASYAAQAVLAALLGRERSGRGTHIDLSLAECVLQWLGVVDRSGTLAPPATLVLETSDDAHVLVQAIMHFHPRLAELVAAVPGSEGFDVDPRFADRTARAANRDAYDEAVRRAFRRRTQAAWLADLNAAGVPAAPVQRSAEVLTHPQLVHRGAGIEADVPGSGPTTLLAPPFVFDGERNTRTTLPPTLGADNAAVLSGWLGYTDEQLRAAAEAGAFGPAGG